MKTKLYKKFVKAACHDLRISRKQLFSRDFASFVFATYTYDFKKMKYDRDSALIVVEKHHPLSQLWHGLDCGKRALAKHWKHSKHKYEIKMRLALGQELSDVLSDIASRRKRT